MLLAGNEALLRLADLVFAPEFPPTFISLDERLMHGAYLSPCRCFLQFGSVNRNFVLLSVGRPLRFGKVDEGSEVDISIDG